MTRKTKNIISLILVLLLLPGVTALFLPFAFANESDLIKKSGKVKSLAIRKGHLDIMLNSSGTDYNYSLYNFSGYSEITELIKAGDCVDIYLFSSEPGRIARDGVDVYSFQQFKNKYTFLVVVMFLITSGAVGILSWRLYRRSKRYRIRKRERSQSHFRRIG